LIRTSFSVAIKLSQTFTHILGTGTLCCGASRANSLIQFTTYRFPMEKHKWLPERR
jgi:hypothetical protein